MGEFAALDGLEVEQVWVWWSLRLVFDLGPPGSPGSYIDVTEFEFTDPSGAAHSIHVERDPVAAGVVLGGWVDDRPRRPGSFGRARARPAFLRGQAGLRAPTAEAERSALFYTPRQPAKS